MIKWHILAVCLLIQEYLSHLTHMGQTVPSGMLKLILVVDIKNKFFLFCCRGKRKCGVTGWSVLQVKEM